ncbi:MAG: energy transducer TonB [Lysobacterales bacterium]
MSRIRYLFAALLSPVITFGVFLFMQALISSGDRDTRELEAISGIHFGPVEIPDDVTTRSRRIPKKPPPPKNPPPPPRMQIARTDQPVQDLLRIDMPNLDVPLVGGTGQGMFIGNYQQIDRNAEGDIIPVVVIRPMYPRDAAIAGIEGWVKIEFTITAVGTVEDPQIIEAEPQRVFNREAIRAILKWKFKPRIVDGVPVPRRATQIIDFNLDNSDG